MPSNYDELPLEGISPFARVELSYAMVGKMIYYTYKIMGGASFVFLFKKTLPTMEFRIFVIAIIYEVYKVSRIHYLVTINTNPFHSISPLW